LIDFLAKNHQKMNKKRFFFTVFEKNDKFFTENQKNAKKRKKMPKNLINFVN